jgi:RNA polymerase sigma-70 factor (ECF subfamily)
VLQSTNLVMWRKAHDFVEGTDFVRWACTIARYEVAAYYRLQSRDRRLLDEETLFRLAERAEQHCRQSEQRLAALRECEKKLKPDQWDLLRERYGLDCPRRSVEEIAQRRGDSPAAVASALYRIRRALFHCIRRQLKESDA